MNIIGIVISIVINRMGGGILRISHFCGEGEKKFVDKKRTHMKNSGDEGLSLVDPASRNPLLAPEPVSFSHLSL